MSDHCQECESDRIAHINGKVSDTFYAEMGDNEHEGYVPMDMGIGGGSYIRFTYCLECGQIQGDFPLEETDVETGVDSDDEDDSEEDVERWSSEADND